MSGRLAEFEPFVKSATPGLMRHAYSLCRDAQLSQDLVQEAFLRVFRNWDRIDMDRNPVAYAYRTVHNLYLSRLERRSSAELPVDSFEDRGGVEEPADQVHLKIEVSRVLSMLPPRERAVLISRYLHDLSVADTAAELGASEAWVRTTSHRALNRLRAVETAQPAQARTSPRSVAF
ncbi:MAG: SigE family RNA polymerase sigma factor [Micropruina sp.]